MTIITMFIIIIIVIVVVVIIIIIIKVRLLVWYLNENSAVHLWSVLDLHLQSYLTVKRTCK